MKIRQILEEIRQESSSNKKLELLKKYKDTPLLRSVLYQAYSRRVKFYIKQIPVYKEDIIQSLELDEALFEIQKFSSREITGNSAIEYLSKVLSWLSKDDAYIVERIIEKDLKIGLASTSINKVLPKLIEETPYMGAQSFSEKLVKSILEKGEAYSQVKMDGRYCNAIIRDSQVELESRQGEVTYVGDAKFLKELAGFSDCVLNGELTIQGFNRYVANGIISSIIDIEKTKKNQLETEYLKKLQKFETTHGSYQHILDRIHFTVWDILTLNDYFSKSSDTPYQSRLFSLEDQLYKTESKLVSIVETQTVKTYEEAISHFQKVLKRGEEGTILKEKKGLWKDGKPNWQVKMKLEIHLDLKIVGFEYGTKGSKNEHVITTLKLESSCGKLKTNPAGMNEEMMNYITKEQESLLGEIVQIRCCGLTPPNEEGIVSTLHPSVEVIRFDKKDYDSLESAIKIEEMSKGLNNI